MTNSDHRTFRLSSTYEALHGGVPCSPLPYKFNPLLPAPQVFFITAPQINFLCSLNHFHSLPAPWNLMKCRESSAPCSLKYLPLLPAPWSIWPHAPCSLIFLTHSTCSLKPPCKACKIWGTTCFTNGGQESCRCLITGVIFASIVTNFSMPTFT